MKLFVKKLGCKLFHRNSLDKISNNSHNNYYFIRFSHFKLYNCLWMYWLFYRSLNINLDNILKIQSLFGETSL